MPTFGTVMRNGDARIVFLGHNDDGSTLFWGLWLVTFDRGEGPTHHINSMFDLRYWSPE